MTAGSHVDGFEVIDVYQQQQGELEVVAIDWLIAGEFLDAAAVGDPGEHVDVQLRPAGFGPRA